jgi:hypothetical protein
LSIEQVFTSDNVKKPSKRAVLAMLPGDQVSMVKRSAWSAWSRFYAPGGLSWRVAKNVKNTITVVRIWSSTTESGVVLFTRINTAINAISPKTARNMSRAIVVSCEFSIQFPFNGMDWLQSLE